MAEREGAGSARRTWEADTALTDLYAARWHSLVRLSWLLVRDQDVAEETVQDAFVAMHSRSVLRHRTVEDRYLSISKGSVKAHAHRGLIALRSDVEATR